MKMDMIILKNFMMDLFRFMKKFPAVTDDNWEDITQYASKIGNKYHNNRLVIHMLLGYENYLEEKEKSNNGKRDF